MMSNAKTVGEPIIVHRDEHLLVVQKPAGLLTTGAPSRPSLTRWAEQQVKQSLHATSRLDSDVTGLVTFARTREANAHLLQARVDGLYHRRYLALAPSVPEPERGSWDKSIALNPRDKRLRIAVEPGNESSAAELKSALTEYRLLASTPNAAALSLSPQTGRTHQLRVHAADAGLPFLGDTRYGGLKRVTLADGRVVRAARTMLHCAWLSLPSMTGTGTQTFTAGLPEDFCLLWKALGGDEADLQIES